MMALMSALLVTSNDVTYKTVHAGDPSNDPFCSVCDFYAEQCLASCPPLGEYGHFACTGSCRLEYKDCLAACYCSQGVGC
jgi:hypothetical protein